MSMNNHELARKIARGIFAVNSDAPSGPVKRIALKGGTWPDNETDKGGLCESALAGVILRVLKCSESDAGVKP
jgi:hypothetical protein